MGTMASMSVSIVTEGPAVGIDERAQCRTQGSALPGAQRLRHAQQGGRNAADGVCHRVAAAADGALPCGAARRVLTVLAAEKNYLDGLVNQLASLTEVTRANGVALLVDDQVYRYGELPNGERSESAGVLAGRGPGPG